LLALKLLVKNLQNHVSRSIVRVTGSTLTIGPEGTTVQSSFRVPVKGNTHSFEPDYVLRCFLSENPNNIAIAQIVARNERILRKALGRVVFAEGGVKAALRNRRVGSQRMNLGNESHGGSRMFCSDGGSQACSSTANDQYIKFLHLNLACS